jgi:DNA-binding transcriptional regulator YiaG
MNIDPSPMSPDELRAALDVLGWTQAELARQIGVTHGTVSHWMMQRHICEGPPALCIRMLVERVQDSPCKIATSDAQ